MLLDSEYLRLDRPEMTAARAPSAAVAAAAVRSVLDVLDPDGAQAHGGVQRGGRRGFIALLVSGVVKFCEGLDLDMVLDFWRIT